VHVRVWEFVVRSDAVAAFVDLYGPGGRWAELFSTYDGYLGTELLADAGDPVRYVTLDRWSDAASSAAVDTTAGAWRALDLEGERLTERETFVGAFDIVPGDRGETGR
jgi:hypothetical protein